MDYMENQEMNTEMEEIQEEYLPEPTIYHVYARVNEKNQVTKIFSSCFEQAEETDVLIKSGTGDEFVHVGYYDIYNSDYSYRYKIENGELTERTEFDRSDEMRLREITSRITELKGKLDGTDYKAIKYSEGLITEEEYAETKVQRMTWRNEINQLEAEQAQIQMGV